MELKDLQSDLEALGKLYGLLRCGGDDTSNVVLGERSKLLLKDLLDVATEKVLETHKKKISAASCSSESENFRAVSEFQPSVSPYMIKDEPGAIQNCMEESNDHAFKSKRGEDFPPKLATHEVVFQQSRLSFSLDNPQNRKSFCQCSEESSMNQQITARNLSKSYPLGNLYLDSGDERKFLEKNEKSTKLERSKETIRQRSVGGFIGTPSLVGSVADLSRSPASGDNLANRDEKIGEAATNFSKDVDNTVRHMESQLSALSLCSKLADASNGALPHSLCSMPRPLCSTVQAKEHSVNKNKLSHAVEPFPQPIGMESQGIVIKDNSNRSHLPLGLTEKDLFDDMMSKKRKIQHKEIGQSSKHMVRSNSRLYETVGNRNGNDMVEKDNLKQSQTASCYVQGLRVPIKQGVSKRPPTPVRMPHAIHMNSRGKESTPTTVKLRPSMTPTQSAASKALVRHNKTLSNQILPEQRKVDRKILKNKILPTQHRDESKDLSNSGSSESDSEAYSWQSEESADSYKHSRSWPSEDSSDSYEHSRSSTSSDYMNTDESGRFYPTRKTEKAINPKSEKCEGRLVKLKNPMSEKDRGKVGKLKRLKNSLAVIFHHHHHHHHHHPHDHEKRSMWTHLHKVFHPEHRHEVHDKVKKGRESIVAIKHQARAGHFHALVEKLIHHSKKSKTSKGGIRRLGNNQNGQKNKKLHLWQMFQRQRRVKLPNRRQFRVGFRSKKKQLRS